MHSIVGDNGVLRAFSSDLDDVLRHMSRHNPHFEWKTGTSDFSKASKWALIASEPAISTTHIDGDGFATVIEMCCGKKKWYIGDVTMNPTRRDGYDNNDSEWEPVTLSEGDWL